jgi:DNA polymerase-3 subunit delta
VAELKPVYLLHGDDEVQLDAARARARERAKENGASFELMDAERDAGEEVALALSSLTLAMGPRYVLVDGIESWKDKDIVPVVATLAPPPPETVVFFVGTVRKVPNRKSWSPPAKLVTAVQKAKGEVHELKSPKASGLPAWIIKQGKPMGLTVDPDAAQALVERIGTRQRRLMRTLEKIVRYGPDGGRVDVELVEALTVTDVESQGYELADAVIAGDRGAALRLAENLQDYDQDIMYILYAMLRRANEVRRAWAVIETGGTTDDVAAALGYSKPWMAKRVFAQARGADGERLERIAAGLADLDFAIRGGGKVDTGTALTLTLAAAA